MNIAAVLTAVFLATGQGAHPPLDAADLALVVTPSPAAAITSSGPVLTQQSPTTWTTTVLLGESSACLSELTGQPGASVPPPTLMAKDLTYRLVTTSPDDEIAGTVTGAADVSAFPVTGAIALDPTTLVPVGAKALPVPCTAAADETASAETEVSIAFTLNAQFTTVPLTATLVIDDPHGLVPVTGAQLMTVRALVTTWQYLCFPILSAVVMALAFALGISLVAWARRSNKKEDPRDQLNPWRGEPSSSALGFWRHPVYASAAWSFADSPATTISVASTLLAGVLAGAGVGSTLLPGIQVDHFAVLLAVWAVLVAVAPLVFGFFNTVTGASRGLVPDNAALLRFPENEVVLHAPAGASLAFASGATAGVPGQGFSVKAGGTLAVPPDSKITVAFPSGTGTMVVPGDNSVVLTGTASIRVDMSRGGRLTVPADALPSKPPPAPVEAPAPAPAPAPTLLGSGEEIRPTVLADGNPTQDGITLKAVGFVIVTVPKDTQVHYPFPDQGITKTFARDTYLRVPMGDKTIVADMRSLIPASLVTILGIGAQLGLLGMLAGELAALPSVAHKVAWAIVGVMAAVMVGYAVVATAELASSRPGSAIASDAQSAYIL